MAANGIHQDFCLAHNPGYVHFFSCISHPKTPLKSLYPLTSEIESLFHHKYNFPLFFVLWTLPFFANSQNHCRRRFSYLVEWLYQKEKYGLKILAVA